MGYSSNDNDNDGDDNQRATPTSNAVRCNDDDERQRGWPLNWYHLLIGISNFYRAVYQPAYDEMIGQNP